MSINEKITNLTSTDHIGHAGQSKEAFSLSNNYPFLHGMLLKGAALHVVVKLTYQETLNSTPYTILFFAR